MPERRSTNNNNKRFTKLSRHAYVVVYFCIRYFPIDFNLIFEHDLFYRMVAPPTAVARNEIQIHAHNMKTV